MRNRRIHGATRLADPGPGFGGWSIEVTTAQGWPRSTAIGCASQKAGRVRSSRSARTRPGAGTCGISHTRWATHGPATDRNAHPHLGGRGRPAGAVVHNGVIENHPPPPRARGAGLRLQEPDRHRGHRAPDRPRARSRRRPVRGCSSASCRGSKELMAWPSSAEISRRKSSAPGSAARSSSAWARASTCSRATPWPSRPTPRGSRTSRTARSFGSRPATSRSGTSSRGRSRPGSTASTGSPTRSSSAGTPTT